MSEQIDRQLYELVQAERAAHLPELPSPSLIWWRAQLMERRRLQAKALQPIAILRSLSAIAIYACAIVLAYISIHAGQLNLAAVVIGGSIFAATHVAALAIYRSFSAKPK